MNSHPTSNTLRKLTPEKMSARRGEAFQMALVDDLIQEAALESSGVFSLDLRQRLLKLTQSQLGSLAAAVLCLVEAAVAAKAERVSCRSQGGSWDPSQATLFLAFHGDNVRLQEAAESQLFGEAIELLRSRGLKIELLDCRGGAVVDRVTLSDHPPELTKAFPAYESETSCQAVISLVQASVLATIPGAT